MSSIYKTLEIGDIFIKQGFPCPFLIAGLTPEGEINLLIMANLAPTVFRGDLPLHRAVPANCPGYSAGRVPTATPAGDTCTLTVASGLDLAEGDYLEIYQDDPTSWRQITAINEVDGLTEITTATIAKPIWYYDPATGITERIQ